VLKILFILILSAGTESTYSQSCGFKANSLIFQQNIQAFNLNNGNTSCSGSFNLPIVIHIIHDGGESNISNQQILDAIELINEHFSGNTNIAFHLASTDPNNNCTNGINRVYTSDPKMDDLSEEIPIKNLSRWPVDKYINVWIVDKCPEGYAGFSRLPTDTSPEIDGIVIDHRYFGNSGTATSNPSNQFVTFTHEMGHYLNLFHVWGLDEGAACNHNCHSIFENKGDLVEDTNPCLGSAYFGDCNTPYFGSCSSCQNTNADKAYPKENFMSYAHSCQNSFSDGQAERMCNAINNYRSSLTWDQSNVEISSNVNYDTPKTVSKDIIIKNGGTLTITANLSMGQGRSITILNGGTLILSNGAYIQKCANALFWNGITVNTGGRVNVNDGHIINVTNGILARKNATLNINTLELKGIDTESGIGLKLETGVINESLKNLNIGTFETGIDARSGSIYYYVENSTISNVKTGIFVGNCSLVLSGSTIQFCENPVSLRGSIGSIFNNNTIEFKKQGIVASFSPYTYIAGNTITYSGLISKEAIKLHICSGSTIENQNIITSDQAGVRITSSNNVKVTDGNIITVSGNNTNANGGIIIAGGKNNDVSHNYVNVTEGAYGIEINNVTNPIINNNDVTMIGATLASNACINIKGSMAGSLSENVMNSDLGSNGLTLNSSFGHVIECNIANLTNEGLSINIASDEQKIKGNQLESSTDLIIKSRIGLQPKEEGAIHHGNMFIGGTVDASALSQIQRENSLFKAEQNNPNFPNLWPSNIIPNDGTWWVPQIKDHFACDGTFGPQFVPFGGDPSKICAYWTYLKSIKNAQPNLFLVNLIHLLKYAKTHPNFVIPNCIKLDPVFTSLCGLTTLVDITVALDNLGNDSLVNISTLQNQYGQSQTQSSRNAIKNQISNLLVTHIPTIELQNTKDSFRLDSIKTQLNAINCIDTLITKWKSVLSLYVKFIKDGAIIQPTDKEALIALSMECADNYGDAIYLARAMTNTFTPTYFDIYDDCQTQTGPRSKKVNDYVNQIELNPNPTTGLVNFRLPSNYMGMAYIISIDGRILRSILIENSNTNEVDISDLDGVYFIKFISNQGKVQSNKIIVLK